MLQSFDEIKISKPPTTKANEHQVPGDDREISIGQLLKSIIDCLKRDSSSWFKKTSAEETDGDLCFLIPQALNYLEYNLKRNNNYINEFEIITRSSRLEQETEELKATMLETTGDKRSDTLATATPTKEVAKKKYFLKKRSKSLKVPPKEPEQAQQATNTQQQPNTSAQGRSPLKSQHDPLLISEQINMQSQLNLLEQDFMNISYYLNLLVKFWSDFATNQHEFNGHLKQFYQNYIEPNQVVLTMLEKYLYQINYKITNKCGSSELLSLSSISIAPALLKNQNFLQNFYKYLNYDFLSYKLFTRQLQLIQLTAILCHLILKIFNYHYKADDANKMLQFPVDQYRPISWSNQHVTLYSSSPKPPKRNMNDSGCSTDQNESFISDLNDFLSLSQLRINNQADIINNFGYFYIVNKLNGFVLEAIDIDGTSAPGQQINAKSKAKCPRFFLKPKTPKANDQQLWYYYLYNGCLANKYIRSSYCMAASSLIANSPVCLWANVSYSFFLFTTGPA